MKFDIIIPDSLDLTEFKEKAIANNKMREASYWLDLGKVGLRLDVDMHDFTERQLVTISIYDIDCSHYTPIMPIIPMADPRYRHLEVMGRSLQMCLG